MSNKSDLYAELKAAEKRANQRLLRLERRDELTPAYRIAVNEIRESLGRKSGLPRFSSRKSMTYNDMQKELSYINRFNSSVSSTITGMRKTVKQRLDTLQKHYDITKSKTTDLFRVLSSSEYKKATELMPSALIVSLVSDALNKGAPSDDIISVLERIQSSEKDSYIVDTLKGMLSDLYDAGADDEEDDYREYAGEDEEDDLPY